MKVTSTLAAAAVVAAVAAGCASGTTTRGQSSPAPASVTGPAPTVSVGAVLDGKFGQTYPLRYIDAYDHNDQAVYTSYDLTVGAPSTTGKALSQYGVTPSNGYYVVFHVTINATSEGVEYNSASFSVRQANGENASCLTGEDTLGSGTLHDNQKAAGTVVCNVPTVHGKLVWDPSRVEYTGSLIEWPF